MGHHNINIRSHIEQSLLEILRIKQKKLKSLLGQDVDEIWLVIINGYFLSDLPVYESLLKNSLKNYIFDKVFVVDKNEIILVD